MSRDRILLVDFIGQLLSGIGIGVVVDDHVGAFCGELLGYQSTQTSESERVYQTNGSVVCGLGFFTWSQL
jgi:hypothetical protein